MKRLLILLVTFITGSACYAQQDALVTQYFFNPLYVNAAYAGSREMVSAVLLYRNQWVGIDGAPVTQTFNIHGPIRKKKIGLGLQIYNDRIGPTRNTGITASYSYFVPIGKGKLSFGLQATLNQMFIDWDMIVKEEFIDPAFDQREFYYIPDANFGLYYYTPNYYAGVSSHHIIENRFEKLNIKRINQEHFYRHLYGLGGVVLEMNDDFHFRPSFLVKYVKGAPVDGEIDASFLYKEKLWMGLGLRNSGRYQSKKRDTQLIAIFEFIFDEHWRFGYSYDIETNELAKYNSGSHEFMLGYNFNLYRAKILTPRYF